MVAGIDLDEIPKDDLMIALQSRYPLLMIVGFNPNAPLDDREDALLFSIASPDADSAIKLLRYAATMVQSIITEDGNTTANPLKGTEELGDTEAATDE